MSIKSSFKKSYKDIRLGVVEGRKKAKNNNNNKRIKLAKESDRKRGSLGKLHGSIDMSTSQICSDSQKTFKL
jgi:hypothetical protein